MIRTARPLILVLALLALPRPAAAVPVTIDFDALQDSDVVTDQFLGVTFENAIVSTLGVSLDPFSHDTPVSGANVLSDFGGPLRVFFVAAPIFSFSGFFNYPEQVTVSGYLGGSFVSSVSSLIGSNFLNADNPSNELLALTGLFDEIVITAGEFGGFTVDNLTFDTEPSSVPEPGTLALIALGGAGLLIRRRRRAS